MRTEAELDQLVAEAFKEKHPSQIGDETRRLASLLNRLEIRTVLEIGSEEGGTVKLWSKLFDPLCLVCIDANTYKHVQGKQQELEALWKSWMKPMQTIDVVWGYSSDPSTKRNVRDVLKSRGKWDIDMLFVDGDHSESGVEKDFLMYGGLVRPGGVMVFADIHSTGRTDMKCWKWWDRFKQKPIDQQVDRNYHPQARPNFIEILHDPGRQQAFGYGVIFV